MFLEWIATPVPLWLLLLVGVFLFLIGIAVNRKFSVTSGWLAILGTLFTPADIKALAILLWRSGVVPDSVKSLRFGGDENNFADYFADLVLKMLPEVGKIEAAIASMLGKVPEIRGPRPVGVYGGKLHLEGRNNISFLIKPMGGRDERPGWPLIDNPVAPPAEVETK